jgi:hypothetical protein
MGIQRWSLDKKAPGLFKDSNGGWVKHSDMQRAVLASIDAALALIPGGTICDPQRIADSIRALKETT